MNGEIPKTARRRGICQTQTAASSNIEATIGENHGQRAGKSKRVPERLMATSGATPATTPIWAIMWMVNEARSARVSNTPKALRAGSNRYRAKRVSSLALRDENQRNSGVDDGDKAEARKKQRRIALKQGTAFFRRFVMWWIMHAEAPLPPGEPGGKHNDCQCEDG